MEFFTDTDLTGYGEAADDDLRVIRQIEKRAAMLHWELFKLQQRHKARLIKLEKNTGLEIEITYDLKAFSY